MERSNILGQLFAIKLIINMDCNKKNLSKIFLKFFKSKNEKQIK